MPRVPDPAELAEDLQRLERAIEASARSTREAIDRLIAEMKQEYVRKDVYEERSLRQNTRISDIEDRHKWLLRTTVAALLFPLLVAVVVALILGVQP